MKLKLHCKNTWQINPVLWISLLPKLQDWIIYPLCACGLKKPADKEDQDRFYLYQQAALKNPSNHICEIQMDRPSGKRFTAQFESRLAPEKPDRLWLAISDISYLKRGKEITARYEAVLAALDALEIERSRFKDLFEFAPDSYFVTDEKGIILDVNWAGRVLVNSTREQLVGTSITQHILRENRPYFFDLLNFV